MEFVKFNLGNNICALVDKEDLPIIAPYRWCHNRYRGRRGYAVTNTIRDNKKCLLPMHRLIMERFLTKEMPLIDHINGDGLDNRKTNLRPCNAQQNSFNYNGYRRFKGVVQLPSGRWNARIKHNQKQTNLGTFDSIEEAAEAYNVKAQLLFGEFARLNIIDEVVT